MSATGHIEGVLFLFAQDLLRDTVGRFWELHITLPPSTTLSCKISGQISEQYEQCVN